MVILSGKEIFSFWQGFIKRWRKHYGKREKIQTDTTSSVWRRAADRVERSGKFRRMSGWSKLKKLGGL